MADYVIFDGYNSDPNAGDELDGAGTNEPVWPALIDSFIGPKPIIVNVEMLAAFEECADFTVPGEHDVVTIRPDPDTLLIRGS